MAPPSDIFAGRRRRLPFVRAATASGAPCAATAAATAAAEFRQLTLRSGVTTDTLELLERCKGPSRTLLQACRVIPPHLNQGHTTWAARMRDRSGSSPTINASPWALSPLTDIQETPGHRSPPGSFSLAASPSSFPYSYLPCSPRTHPATASPLLRTSHHRTHGRAATPCMLPSSRSDTNHGGREYSADYVKSTSSRKGRAVTHSTDHGHRRRCSSIHVLREELRHTIGNSKREKASVSTGEPSTLRHALGCGGILCQPSSELHDNKELFSLRVRDGAIFPTQGSCSDSSPCPVKRYTSTTGSNLSVASMEVFERSRNKARSYSAAAAASSCGSNTVRSSCPTSAVPSMSSSFSPRTAIPKGSSRPRLNNPAEHSAVVPARSPSMLYAAVTSNSLTTAAAEADRDTRSYFSACSPRGNEEILDIDVWWEPIRKKINVLSDLCKDMLRDIHRVVQRQRLSATPSAEIRVNSAKNCLGTATLLRKQQGDSKTTAVASGMAALLKLNNNPCGKLKNGTHTAASSSFLFPPSAGEGKSLYFERSASKNGSPCNDSNLCAAYDAASAGGTGDPEQQPSASSSPSNMKQERADSVTLRSKCSPAGGNLKRRCSSVISRTESCSFNSTNAEALESFPPPSAAAVTPDVPLAGAGHYGKEKRGISWIQLTRMASRTVFESPAARGGGAAAPLAGFGLSPGVYASSHTPRRRRGEEKNIKGLFIPQEDAQAKLPVFTQYLGELAEILRLSGPEKKTRRSFVAAGCPFLIPPKEMNSFFSFAVIKHSLSLPSSYTWNQKVHTSSSELNEALLRLCRTISRQWVADLYNVAPPNRRGTWQQLLRTVESQLEVFNQSYRKFEHVYCTEMLTLLASVFKPLELMCKEAALLLEKLSAGAAVEGLSQNTPEGLSRCCTSFSPRPVSSVRKIVNTFASSSFSSNHPAETSSSRTFLTQVSNASCGPAATVSTSASARRSSSADYKSYTENSTEATYNKPENFGSRRRSSSMLKSRGVSADIQHSRTGVTGTTHDGNERVVDFRWSSHAVGRTRQHDVRRLLQREMTVDFQHICESNFLQQLGQLYDQGGFSTTDVPVENFDPDLLNRARKIVSIWETSNTSKLTVAYSVASCLLFVTHRCWRQLAHMKPGVDNFSFNPDFVANEQLKKVVNEYEEVWRVAQYLLDEEVLMFAEGLMEMLTRNYGSSSDFDGYPAITRNDVAFDFHTQDAETSAAMQQMQALLSLPDPPDVILYDLLPILLLFELLLRSDTATYEKLFIPENEEAQDLFKKIRASAKELKLCSWKKLRLHVLQQLLAKTTLPSSQCHGGFPRTMGGRGGGMWWAEGMQAGPEKNITLKVEEPVKSCAHSLGFSPAPNSSTSSHTVTFGGSTASPTTPPPPLPLAGGTAAAGAAAAGAAGAAAAVVVVIGGGGGGIREMKKREKKRGGEEKVKRVVAPLEGSADFDSESEDIDQGENESNENDEDADENNEEDNEKEQEEDYYGPPPPPAPPAPQPHEYVKRERKELSRKRNNIRGKKKTKNNHHMAEATQVQRYEMLTSYFLRAVECLLPHQASSLSSSNNYMTSNNSPSSSHWRSRQIGAGGGGIGGGIEGGIGGGVLPRSSNNTYVDSAQQNEEKASPRDARCSMRWENLFDYVKAEILCRSLLLLQQQQQSTQQPFFQHRHQQPLLHQRRLQQQLLQHQKIPPLSPTKKNIAGYTSSSSPSSFPGVFSTTPIFATPIPTPTTTTTMSTTTNTTSSMTLITPRHTHRKHFFICAASSSSSPSSTLLQQQQRQQQQQQHPSGGGHGRGRGGGSGSGGGGGSCSSDSSPSSSNTVALQQHQTNGQFTSNPLPTKTSTHVRGPHSNTHSPITASTTSSCCSATAAAAAPAAAAETVEPALVLVNAKGRGSPSVWRSGKPLQESSAVSASGDCARFIPSCLSTTPRTAFNGFLSRDPLSVFQRDLLRQQMQIEEEETSLPSLSTAAAAPSSPSSSSYQPPSAVMHFKGIT